jgi:hypothetical protein
VTRETFVHTYVRCHDEVSLNKVSMNIISGIINTRPQDKSSLPDQCLILCPILLKDKNYKKKQVKISAVR